MIGITSYALEKDGNYRIPSKYTKAMQKMGAASIILTPDNRDIQTLLSLCDGVILSGGGDIHPRHYKGNHKIPELYDINDERDAFEFEILKSVLEKDIPCLCICRGMQLMNVYFRGTLHEHYESPLKDLRHRSEDGEKAEIHEVSIHGGKLWEIFSRKRLTSVSWHHQSVKKVGKGLDVTAISDDGCIEGIEYPHHPFLIGVQWHPEMEVGKVKFQKKLFTAFLDACQKK